MSANDYHLVSNWRVLGSVEEVFDVISRVETLPEWWPAGFRDVLVIDQGDDRGNGAIVRMTTKGYLPYQLRWHLRATDVVPPSSIQFKVWGDLEGTGSWTFLQNDAWCDVTYTWDISHRKGPGRYLSFLARPFLVSNHNRVMARGEESLRLELARRHAASDLARASIPPPPQAAELPWAVPVILAASLFGLLFLRRRGGRGRS